MSNICVGRQGSSLQYNGVSENRFKMKIRIAILLLLLFTLTGCGEEAQAPQPQSVSIAQRGESLEGAPPVEMDPSVTETATATETLAAATATVTAAPTDTLPAPTATLEATLTAEPTSLITETVESAVPVETSETPEGVCSPETNRQFGAEAIAAVNAARVRAGLSALIEQAQLTQIARQHSEAMACEGFFGHVTPDGLDVEARAEQAGYPFISLGEVIAGGYASPEEAVGSWLKSAAHRAVLLDDAFTEIGAGYVYVPDSEYLYYWTLVFGSSE